MADLPLESLLLDAADELLMLVEAPDLSIRAVNRALVEQLGYARDGLIGRPVADIECALSDLFWWEDVLAGGGGGGEVVGAYQRADGSVLDVSKSLRSVGPGLYAVRARPIENEQRTEHALSHMGLRLRATLEATADGILLVDRSGAILNMNHRFSELWAVPADLLLKNDDEGVLRWMRSLIAANCPAGTAPWPDPGSDESTFDALQLADGRVFERHSYPARDGEQIIGRVFSYRDVSERERTQRELRAARDEATRASQAKSEFLAMMSHEIRTPMNGVLGLAELLAMTPLNSEQADLVRTIRASGESLLGIINDILDYSKIEAGKLTLERTCFDLPELVDDVRQLFRFRTEHGNVELRCSVAPDVPHAVMGDPTRLRQILLNLIGNAFKFTEQGSVVLEIVAAGVAGLRFTVRDTGIGIPTERQSSIFEAFEQADASTVRRYGGTGLGLSICRRLVHLMHGDIGVVSTVGVGSEFWFTVRLDSAPNVAPEATAMADPVSGSLTGVRVLVVDDNAVNQRVLSGMLGKLGCTEVRVEGDGRAGVAAAQAAPFDIIFMDTLMPEMDGLEATRALRAGGYTGRIVGVSAGILEEERVGALAAGMDDYLLKPVMLDALREAIAHALA